METLIEYSILELYRIMGNNLGIIENNVCSYIMKMFCKLCKKVKDVEYEEESKDVFHSALRIDNESINESEVSSY